LRQVQITHSPQPEAHQAAEDSPVAAEAAAGEAAGKKLVMRE
jgi:hypothetical protein